MYAEHPCCADHDLQEQALRLLDAEELYAVRRADGELMGDFLFWIAQDARDWDAANLDSEYEGNVTTYEMVHALLEVVDVRRYPRCSQCDEPAPFWGLCETHARQDDPETLEEALRDHASDAQ